MAPSNNPSSFKILILPFFLAFLVSEPTYAKPFRYIINDCDGSAGNYTETSAYKTNIDNVLSTLVTQASDRIFYNTSHGTGNDEAFGMFYCRFDIKPSVCHACVQDAAEQILQECSIEKTAVVFYDLCILRYAPHTMDGVFEDVGAVSRSRLNVTNPVEYLNAVAKEMSWLIQKAAYNKSYEGRAYGVRSVTGIQKVYCFVQCRPDSTGYLCERCLKGSVGYLDVCCKGGSRWAMQMNVNCYLRYDMSPFLEVPMETEAPPPSPSHLIPPPPLFRFPPPRLPPPSPPSPPPGSGKNVLYYITRVAIPTVAGIVFLLLVVVVCLCFFKRKPIATPTSNSTAQPGQQGPKNHDQLQAPDWNNFEFETIEIATSKFCISNKLGEGGFGVVYRGVLQNGKEVAVKRLSRDAGQGAREFKTEVEVLARLQHKNLVQLVGFCMEGEEKLLIYEFLPNLSLDRFLFDKTRSPMVTWPLRYKIISGTARGLHYLHEDSRQTIIHRDLKSSNILLDDQLNPKIGDFGIARLVKLDQTTVFSTRLVGTFGYMAPEYATTGRFSIKSDVYSFGVIVLEILSGKEVGKFYHQIHMEGLLGHSWRIWAEGSIRDLVDPSMGNNYSFIEVEKCLHIALLCVQDDPYRRPTMQAVLEMLLSSTSELPPPVTPSLSKTYETNRSASTTNVRYLYSGGSANEDTGSFSNASVVAR